jgi:hypothetical protein
VKIPGKSSLFAQTMIASTDFGSGNKMPERPIELNSSLFGQSIIMSGKAGAIPTQSGGEVLIADHTAVSRHYASKMVKRSN